MTVHHTPLVRLCQTMASMLLLGLAGLPGVAGAIETADAHRQDRANHVRCDRGHSLGAALRRAEAGSTLIIVGTCREAVTVSTDGLQLRGHGSAGIDGSSVNTRAVLTINGARGITLKNLSVRGGKQDGVLWTRGTQGRMEQVAATGHGGIGLNIDGADVEIDGLTLQNNGGNGMDAYAGATVVMNGAVVASQNGGDGIAVNAKTYLELRGAKVTANQNAGSGINVINDSRLQVLSFVQAQSSSVTATANGFAGIGLLGSTLGVVGGQYFGSGSVVLRSNGNAIGLFMPAGSILSPHATAKFEISQNGVGMLMEDGASALIVGGLQVSQNQTGISANGAGTLTLVSVPPNPSTLSGNQLDAALAFGTRMTTNGIAVGSMTCDKTVLARGSAVCP